VLSGGAIGAGSGALIGWAAGLSRRRRGHRGQGRTAGRLHLRPVREIPGPALINGFRSSVLGKNLMASLLAGAGRLHLPDASGFLAIFIIRCALLYGH